MVPAILLSGAAVGLGGSETMHAKWHWVYPTMGVSVTALYVYVWTTTGGPYG
jgi:TRAP-type C4-dicarboxylate transport system permease small subunit